MSIDYIFDEYLEDTGLDRSAEVVPDHACQIFDTPEGAIPGGDSRSAEPTLEQARDKVNKYLA